MAAHKAPTADQHRPGVQSPVVAWVYGQPSAERQSTAHGCAPGREAAAIGQVHEWDQERAARSVAAATDTVVLGETVSADGERNVIAYDGSIVFIGDNGRLRANTGDVSSSGVVGIDADSSELASGSSTVTGRRRAVATPVTQRTAGADGMAPSAPGPANSAGQNGSGMGVAISGFENHSVNVRGDDNRATYDDSNLLLDRDGNLNANTGDTDSSGLNVVDATRSKIRTGIHDEGEESGENGEEEESGGALSAPSAPRSTSSISAPSPPVTDASASVTDPDVQTVATGEDALAIGADGYDDLSLNVAGNRNYVTYDDSNLVEGGTGDVNAQIGDSDTSGAVIMGVTDSVIASGDST